MYPGSKVNVRWKGTWYDGIISKIGSKRQMCRVSHGFHTAKQLSLVSVSVLCPSIPDILASSSHTQVCVNALLGSILGQKLYKLRWPKGIRFGAQ